MKRNKEIILKYLSGQMSDDEMRMFENELGKSDELNAELSGIKRAVDSLRVSEEISVNEAYFNNLIPRIHARIDHKKKFLSFSRFYYFVPTAAAVIIAFLFLFRGHNGFDYNAKDLVEEIVNNISDSTTSDQYMPEIETDSSGDVMAAESDEFTIHIPEGIDLSSAASSILQESPVPDEYSVKNMTDKDLRTISDKMNTIKLR